jgi:hypothetical protein
LRASDIGATPMSLTAPAGYGKGRGYGRARGLPGSLAAARTGHDHEA